MGYRLVGIGELLWDVFPGGRHLGGAPANFAYHARALGAEAQIVSRVGDDRDGRDLLRRLAELGLPADAVETDPAAPTGTVRVEVDARGEPRYTILEGVAWDNLRGEEAGRAAVAGADAVCFGTLAQRAGPSRAAIRALVEAAPATALRVFDINLRQHYSSRDVIEQSLALADVLKCNEAELPILAEPFGLGGDARETLAALADRFGLRAAALTRGGRGSLLLVGGKASDHPGIPARGGDAVGAGDSFTAALTLGLLAGWGADAINARANAVASYVASQPGATPPLPDALCQPFRSTPPQPRENAP